MINQVEQFIDKEFANFLFNYTLHTDNKVTDNDQVQGAQVSYNDLNMRILLSTLKPKVEEAYGKRLHETYAFYRLYTYGQDLKKHTDRPACEVSVTLCLGYNFDYQWPIYVDGKAYGMSPGQGIIYKGCEQVHWRDPLVYTSWQNEEVTDTPNLIHSQVFLHYIEAGGQYDPEHRNDAANIEGQNNERTNSSTG